MMFLQWAIWGAWLPLLLPYLVDNRHFEYWQIGYIFAVGAVGAIFAPFIAGQIADRYFATERFLGICHLLGAALVWQLATLDKFESFLWFSLGVFDDLHADAVAYQFTLVSSSAGSRPRFWASAQCGAHSAGFVPASAWRSGWRISTRQPE